MTNFNPQLSLLLFEPNRRCWSNKSLRYYTSNDIQDQIWETPEKTFGVLNVTLEEAIKTNDAHKGGDKHSRNALFLMNNPTAPVKNETSFDKWSGYIFVDLDLNKVNPKLNKDQSLKLLDALDYALQCEAPHNYKYIEHSSSEIGIHIIFGFDVEKTEYNFHKYAKYVYETLHNIDKYIKDFSKIIDQKGVFDPVYDRPWQKLYITGFNHIIHNISGSIDDINVEYEEKELNDIIIEGNGIIIETETRDVETELHYTDRFVVFNTLKHNAIPIDKAREITSKIYDLIGHKSKHTKNEWFSECKGVYKQNTTLNTKRGISLLSRLGFDIGSTTQNDNDDTNKIKLESYISEVKDVETLIYKKLEQAIRLSMTAPTGTGKTEFIKLFSSYLLKQNRCVLTLTPQNTTNDLYTKLNRTHHLRKNNPKARNRNANLIGTQTNNYEFKLDKMNIMLWDQLYKYTDVLKDNDVVIIVDEAHKIIEDTYRPAAEQAFKILNEHKGMELYITATEIQEMNDALNVKSTIEFTKDRKNNTIKFVNENNDRDAMKLLKSIINIGIKGDAPHIMVCNDNIFNVMQDYCFRCSTIPNIYRSENWSTKMVDNQALDILLKTEKVNETTPISLMTNICFQGINIKNKNKMVVVIPFFIGTTSAQQIEQIIGRVRNAEAEIIVVCCWSWNNEAAEKLNEVMADRDPLYQQVVEAHNMRKTKANAIYDLMKRGFNVLVGPGPIGAGKPFYFNFEPTKPKMKQSIIGKYERKLYDYIKKQECDAIENDYIDDLLFKQEYEFSKESKYKQIIDGAKSKFNDNKYLNAILDDVVTWGLCRHFVEYIKYAGIGDYAKPHFDKLMKYLIGARQLQSFTFDELEQTIERVETTIKMTKFNGVSKKKANAIKAQMSKQFEKSFVIPATIVMDGFNGVRKIYDIIVEFSTNKAKGGAKGGANGSPKKCVEVTELMKQSLKEKYNLNEGDVYGSCEAMSEAINVTVQTISRWVKSGWLKAIDCEC